MKTSKQFKG